MRHFLTSHQLTGRYVLCNADTSKFRVHLDLVEDFQLCIDSQAVKHIRDLVQLFKVKQSKVLPILLLDEWIDS